MAFDLVSRIDYAWVENYYMKDLYRIGKNREYEIRISDKNCPILYAEIKYEKGHWTLINLEMDKPIYVNDEIIKKPRRLDKNDILIICNKKIYWNNYLYEGEDQALQIKDICSFNGRLCRSNFRSLSLLALGLAIGILFLPALLVAFWEYINRRKFRSIEFNTINTIQDISPIIYIVGYSVLSIVMLLFIIKRIRDTRKPIWNFLY